MPLLATPCGDRGRATLVESDRVCVTAPSLVVFDGLDPLANDRYTSHLIVVKCERDDMTQLLEKAFEKASKLPPQEQDLIAQQVLEEMDSERQWQYQLQKSQDLLGSLADEALDEHKAGKTQDLDPDTL